jgi:hypothetical protein
MRVFPDVILLMMGGELLLVKKMTGILKKMIPRQPTTNLNMSLKEKPTLAGVGFSF